MGKGYKWFADRLYNIYIIEIQYNNIEIDNGCIKAYKTSDCVVMSIARISDNKKFNKVTGCAYVDYSYHVGQRIKNTWIYFCLSIDDLLESQENIINQIDSVHNAICLLIRKYKAAIKENKEQAAYLKKILVYAMNGK